MPRFMENLPEKVVISSEIHILHSTANYVRDWGPNESLCVV